MCNAITLYETATSTDAGTMSRVTTTSAARASAAKAMPQCYHDAR
jgi:hypothetical protein